LSKTIPLTICVSSIEPPAFFSTLIFSRSTEKVSPFFVAILRMASTIILESNELRSYYIQRQEHIISHLKQMLDLDKENEI